LPRITAKVQKAYLSSSTTD